MNQIRKSDLHENPFVVLGVTIRDGMARIIEAAEERALVVGDDQGERARAVLTNPRLRLAAELAWLPGVAPTKAQKLFETLDTDPHSLRSLSGIPTLAHLNLLVAGIQQVGANLESTDLGEFILDIVSLAEALDPSEILRDLNEERAVSGFAKISDVSQIEEELVDRNRRYRDALKSTLNELPADKIVETMHFAVDHETVGGELHASKLLDDLVDGYEVDVQGFLEAEATNVRRLLDAIQSAAAEHTSSLDSLIDKLEIVAANWDRVAQPIQLSCKSRGIEHAASSQIAHDIRDVAVDLWNKHNLLEQSQRLAEMNQSLFSELPEFSERVEQDLEAISGIHESRRENARENAQWERDITYSAEVGLIFKDRLSISPAGVSWNDRSMPLEQIRRVRWGATAHSINGIRTRTTYTFAIGDQQSEITGTMSNENVFATFIDKLWRAVCTRLLHDLVIGLRAGREFAFGGGRIRDDGVVLIKHKIFGANEYLLYPWGGVETYSENGSFFIRAIEDRKAYVSASYMEASNTHIFEQLISLAFKKPGAQRLSDILK